MQRPPMEAKQQQQQSYTMQRAPSRPHYIISPPPQTSSSSSRTLCITYFNPLIERKRSSSSQTNRFSGAHLSSSIVLHIKHHSLFVLVLSQTTQKQERPFNIVSYHIFHAPFGFERSLGDGGSKGTRAMGSCPILSTCHSRCRAFLILYKIQR